MSGTQIARLYKPGESELLRFVDTPPLNPNLPAGYTFLKSLDFSSADGWEVRDGQVKIDCTMREENVTFGQGADGNGLVLLGGRDENNGTVWGSEIRGNGGSGKHALPSYRYTICRFREDESVGGNFPAIWERGLSQGDGELDHFERFGNTMHANMHSTPYTVGVHRTGWVDGMPTFPGGLSPGPELQHTVETLMTPEGFTVWFDGVFSQTWTPASFNATAIPTDASTEWSPQFDTDAKTWQPIFSNQWHDGYAGGIQDTAFEWRFYIDSFHIYVPPEE